MMTTTVETSNKKSDRKTGGKKKKNKGMLLFATGAQRKYQNNYQILFKNRVRSTAG